LMDGALTFRQHAGPHTDAPNWPVFIEFADRELRSQPLAGGQRAGVGR
jgi:hypothetical protein